MPWADPRASPGSGAAVWAFSIVGFSKTRRPRRRLREGPEIATANAELTDLAPARDSADRLALRGFISIAGELTNAQEEGRDLDEILDLIVTEIASLLRVPRVLLFLRDENARLYRGQVGFGADDNLVKRLIGGVEADRFTREIAETKVPLTLTDAMSDPRTISSTMRQWGVRSVMGIPMVLDETVIGILFVDSKEDRRIFTAVDEEVASAFATLAAVGVFQAQLMDKLHRTHAALAQQNRALKSAAVVDDKLTRLVIDGCDLAEITAAVASLVASPCGIYGCDYEVLAQAAPEGLAQPRPEALRRFLASDPSVAESPADATRRTAVVGPFPGRELRQRLLLAPIVAGGERLGTLVMTEAARRISDFDVLVARRAANVVALEMVAQRRVVAAEWDARSSLAAHLIHGTSDRATLERQAAFLGVGLELPRMICLFSLEGTPTSFDGRTVAAAVAEIAPDLDLIATSVTEGVAVCLQVPDGEDPASAQLQAKEIVARACDELRCFGPIAASLSEVCVEPMDYPRGYAVAQETLRCVVRFCPPGERSAVLAAGELGASRLFLSAVDRESAEAFAEQTFSDLLADSRLGEQLLATLKSFIEHGSSIRATAASLKVHENTIRYRLDRAESLTGANFSGEADALLQAQLAFKILDLRALAEA